MAEQSTASASTTSDAPSSSPSSSGNYTFLVTNVSKPPGSQHVEQQLSTMDKQDRFAHTRTKRKRTSAEDFTVLEAEYQINAKPDKNTRAALANRVSLSEKEIQVWFQNRRQMTRRKRHTWQPNEITSIIRSSQDVGKDATSGATSPDSSFSTGDKSFNQSQGISLAANDSQEEEGFGEYATQSTDHSLSEEISQDVTLSQSTLPSSYEEIVPSQDKPSRVSSQAFTPRKLKRTSSMVRIAMSLDGQASVILRGQTPSPPSKTLASKAAARAGLERSKSMISTTSLASSQDIPKAPLSSIPRVPGRSRDARNWEFWCDSERRELLTKSAEIDQRGSAAGPLSLLRSGSSGKQYTKIDAGSKKRKSDGLTENRPKLSRTKSSYARLQSSNETGKTFGDPKAGSVTIHIDGDSDKENIDPEASTSVPTPRRVVTPRVLGTKRQALQENTNLPSHSTSLGVLLAKEQRNTPARSPSRRERRTIAAEDQENVPVDAEVAGFTKGGSPNRGEDERLAIQNLLRLSQGAWP